MIRHNALPLRHATNRHKHKCKRSSGWCRSHLSGYGSNLTAGHLQATFSKLLTYCVLRSTQPPTPSGMEDAASSLLDNSPQWRDVMLTRLFIFHKHNFAAVKETSGVGNCTHAYSIVTRLLTHALQARVQLLWLYKYKVPLKTRAQLSLWLADRTRGAHSQPAPITVRV